MKSNFSDLCLVTSKNILVILYWLFYFIFEIKKKFITEILRVELKFNKKLKYNRKITLKLLIKIRSPLLHFYGFKSIISLFCLA